jgi:hypothetical protein
MVNSIIGAGGPIDCSIDPFCWTMTIWSPGGVASSPASCMSSRRIASACLTAATLAMALGLLEITSARFRGVARQSVSSRSRRACHAYL